MTTDGTRCPIVNRPDEGLTTGEAIRRLAESGPNEPVAVRQWSALKQFVELFANPLVVILLAASAISTWLGEHTDALLIVTIVLIGTLINLWQSYRSQQAAAALRASVAPMATVKRDGSWRELPIREVVPGDVFRLVAGDLVPADGRLLDSRDLAVQEAMLTGESLPADKHVRVSPSAAGDADDATSVFLGTSVVSGTGTAVVTATGVRTRFGDIARRLGTPPPVSEFEHGLRRFSLLILRTTMALVLFILLVTLVLRRDPVESLLFAVALGVGLTPEFLPMIASVTLTAGALRMARDGVIVRRLQAMQNFGSIDVFCTDKTGTLTTGEMRVVAAVDAHGAESGRVRRLAEVNSRFQTGIRSPLDTALLLGATDEPYVKVDEIPFDFERRRVSVVVDAPDGRRLLIAKGAPEQLVPLAAFTERRRCDCAVDETRLAPQRHPSTNGSAAKACASSPWRTA